MIKDNKSDAIKIDGEDVVNEVRNWYYDRHSSVIAQRNLLLLIAVILAISCFVGIIFIKDLTMTKTIKPFIIQVEEGTGMTTVVDSNKVDNIVTKDESVKSYFIVKYIRARETYSNINYQYNYDTAVRLMSSQSVYSGFRKKFSAEDTDPISMYADHTQTTLVMRSIQYDSQQPNVATVRFKIVESGQRNASYNKIVSIRFELLPMKLSLEESFINPIGFRVTSYRIDDEILEDLRK